MAGKNANNMEQFDSCFDLSGKVVDVMQSLTNIKMASGKKQ